MVKLSDYVGEEAIELWADLLDPISAIITDEKVASVIKSGKSKLEIAKTILLEHKAEAKQILVRIDPTPIDGINLVMRLVSLLAEIGSNEEIRPFFGYAAQEEMDSESSGSAMENTKASEK